MTLRAVRNISMACFREADKYFRQSAMASVQEAAFAVNNEYIIASFVVMHTIFLCRMIIRA